MEFRVLGPLEVIEAGRAVELGGPKQRALLALLLLSANRVVPSERLIDDLWDDDPPSTAGAGLHVYVSRLRKSIGPGRVGTEGGGYVLRLGPGELDLERFETIARAGREALASAEPERAARTLRAALDLWRGPPLAGSPASAGRSPTWPDSRTRAWPSRRTESRPISRPAGTRTSWASSRRSWSGIPCGSGRGCS